MNARQDPSTLPPPAVVRGGFASFWQGPRLSGFEAACLHSFARAGNDVVLFSYEPVEGVPDGVQARDAREVTDSALLNRFIIDGKPSVSHFSDYFRYVMFACTELTWIDTDVLLLAPWRQAPHDTLLALETPDSICNAVMRLSSQEPCLDELIQRARALADQPMRYGETGPRLLTSLCGKRSMKARAAAPHVYFPIHYDEFWKVFLPEHADECRALCSRARTLHLWNNVVDRLGFWKDLLPPRGSYLHDLFLEADCTAYFQGELPLKNMRQLVENWQSRQTGMHLGIRGVARQIVPSMGRTLRHYAG